MRPLIELLKAVPEAIAYPESLKEFPVTAITVDSRKVTPGSMFAALKGEKLDGTAYITKAEESGAKFALCDSISTIEAKNIVLLKSKNPRLALAQMAAAFYQRQPEHMVAITGTDGKTSTADFFRQFNHLHGLSTASMGTLGVINGEGKNLYPGTLTTPDAVEVHRILAELAGKGVKTMAMEASSHGLHQYRLHGVRLEAAAFTNIARDHLDYHQNEGDYFSAKAMLFSDILPSGKTAVLNADDAKFSALREISKARGHRIVSFGKNGQQLTIESITPHPHGQKVRLALFHKRYDIDVPLVGGFQVMNILAALGLIVGVNGDLEKYLGYIPKLKGVPGRLEQVASLKNGASVLIDYAHTPMALSNILRTLRPHTKNKLHVVFGCGGDRDAGKRPLMGSAARELADVTIVTDDNPRSEDAALIRKAVMEGAGAHAKEVAGREEAIYLALKGVSAGDVLVIAGKGHEKTQIIGKEQLPFDDAEVAQRAARELGLLA